MAAVEDRVHHGVGHPADLDHQRRAPGLERLEVALGLLGVARVEHDHRGQLHPRPVRGVDECGEHGEIVGAVRDRVAIEAEQIARRLDRVGDQAARDHLQRVQAVREGRRDAEVAAAAAQRPEEVRVGRLGHFAHLAGGVDELDGQQVVGGQAVLGHQPAEAAAERQPGDSGRGDRTAGDGEAVLARLRR